MEDNNKLFVFERKEVVLIFVFIILIAVIAFTLGVRTGKSLSRTADGYTQEDVRNINLKSNEEEYVEEVIEKKEATGFEKSMEETSEADKDVTDPMETRLREEMEKLANKADVRVEPPEGKVEEAPTVDAPVKEETQVPANTQMNQDYTGKYTIQLFSHQSRETAEEFADGFTIKGYDVIINEVVIPGKGKWYRVGIGAFKTVNEAEDYLQKEKALFQDNKYIIQKI